MPSATCFALIRKSEGLRLTPYRDGGGVLTVGWGHTGPDVLPNKKITMDEAEAMLSADVAHASKSVLELTSGKVSQGQLDALTDFVFNCGADKLKKSTLLRLHRAGEYPQAAAQFARWVHDARGNVEAGLVYRRAAETHLYLGWALP